MTTETTCLSSIWPADHTLKAHLAVLGRGEAFKPQAPADGAYYDGLIEVELDKIRPMIALPFHPSNAYTIQEFQENLDELLHQVDEDTVRQLKLKNRPASLREKIVDGKFRVDQGVIAGCSGGTYQNIVRAAQILDGRAIGSGEFWLSVYPTSQPVNLELTRRGYIASLMAAGASIRSCFCGPCFGAGDVPANGAFSIRHSTRNFPNREGSKPSDGQVSYVALMDARSIAATALNGGVLTGADELPAPPADPAEEPFAYDDTPYKARVYFGVGRPDPGQELVFGPNIADWPEQVALPENLLLTVCSAIYDPVTTTDELIPSGETSSYRSNPVKLSEFALSRKDPQYVPRAKEVLAVERLRRTNPGDPRVGEALLGHDPADTGLGSLVMALKPGDGSAREQAASCQRVLGGAANLAAEYATKRYRSNVVNWGMLPFIAEDVKDWNLQPGDRIYLPGIRAAVDGGAEEVSAVLLQNGTERPVTLKLPGMTREERDIVLAGCLINYVTGGGVAARPEKAGKVGADAPSARPFSSEPLHVAVWLGRRRTCMRRHLLALLVCVLLCLMVLPRHRPADSGGPSPPSPSRWSTPGGEEYYSDLLVTDLGDHANIDPADHDPNLPRAAGLEVDGWHPALAGGTSVPLFEICGRGVTVPIVLPTACPRLSYRRLRPRREAQATDEPFTRTVSTPI